jgi:hypothetical protein
MTKGWQNFFSHSPIASVKNAKIKGITTMRIGLCEIIISMLFPF